MAGASTTIQVSRDTAERLSSLKIPGLTYDDVIRFALDRLPPKEIQRLFNEWQEEAFTRLLANPKVGRLN